MGIENSARYLIIGWLMISDNPVYKSWNVSLYHLEFIIEDFKFVEFIIKSKELNKKFFFQNRTN